MAFSLRGYCQNSEFPGIYRKLEINHGNDWICLRRVGSENRENWQKSSHFGKTVKIPLFPSFVNNVKHPVDPGGLLVKSLIITGLLMTVWEPLDRGYAAMLRYGLYRKKRGEPRIAAETRVTGCGARMQRGAWYGGYPW